MGIDALMDVLRRMEVAAGQARTQCLDVGRAFGNPNPVMVLLSLDLCILFPPKRPIGCLE
jgi:hypothetical protein